MLAVGQRGNHRAACAVTRSGSSGPSLRLILVVTALLSMEIGGVSARIDNMDGRLERIEMNVCGMDVRLHSDEIVFGKGDQRLETLERAILPTASP